MGRFSLKKKRFFWTIYFLEFSYTWDWQHLVLRKKFRALFNYLQGVNWKQILINLNVKAIQVLQNKRRRKLNFGPFFIVYQVGFQNFLYRVVVFLCRTHWSDAPTTLIHLVFYFASKALRKKSFFNDTDPHQGHIKLTTELSTLLIVPV